MQLDVHIDDDTEIAATTAQGPEQVLLLIAQAVTIRPSARTTSAPCPPAVSRVSTGSVTSGKGSVAKASPAVALIRVPSGAMILIV